MAPRPKLRRVAAVQREVIVQSDHVIEESFKEVAGGCRDFLIDGSPQVRLCACKVHSTVKKGPRYVCRFGKSNRKGRWPVRTEDEPAGENGAR